MRCMQEKEKHEEGKEGGANRWTGGFQLAENGSESASFQFSPPKMVRMIGKALDDHLNLVVSVESLQSHQVLFIMYNESRQKCTCSCLHRPNPFLIFHREGQT